MKIKERGVTYLDRLCLAIIDQLSGGRPSEPITYQQMRERTGASIQGLHDSTKRLQKAGLLKVERSIRGTPNRYTVLQQQKGGVRCKS